ncbi:hypothetical protein AMAG_10192 [Allomyces macrogynus ATCC 38327]|uniref:DH domain-containing protein n=1 Tax=Allomyces macrogynus (strain ATCC 38327) TaxID=578462 RepID=A0A0L0SQS8_ALLM3|nr:hypothetical protein AMAG_10192 [Allomyces macrogynus ATCC 38327]|eukprot:KNE64857.1 hypothetical protein AMAG_10192 [Allomyces macrogynus ATCC 38327]
MEPSTQSGLPSLVPLGASTAPRDSACSVASGSQAANSKAGSDVRSRSPTEPGSRGSPILRIINKYKEIAVSATLTHAATAVLPSERHDSDAHGLAHSSSAPVVEHAWDPNPVSPHQQSVPHATDQSITDAAKYAQRRQSIAYELYTTECSYLDGLEDLLTRIVDPLVAHARTATPPLLTTQDCTQIFRNLVEIVALSRSFLLALEVQLFGGKSQMSARPMPKSTMRWHGAAPIALLLQRMGPFFKVYATFASGYQASLLALTQFFARFPQAKNVVRAGDHPILHIQSHLILPVQRIPRYRLLVRDLLSTTEHLKACATAGAAVPADLIQDVQQLEATARIIHDVADFVNEAIRQEEHANYVLQVQQRLLGCSIPLLLPSRRLVLVGDLKKVSRKSRDDRHVLLFNDVLILTSRAPSNRLLFHRSVDVSDIARVRTVTAVAFAFEIVTRDKSFVLVAESESTAQEWIRAITRAKTDLAQSPPPASARAPVPSVTAAVRPDRPHSVPVIRDYVAPVWVPDNQASTTTVECAATSFVAIARAGRT